MPPFQTTPQLPKGRKILKNKTQIWSPLVYSIFNSISCPWDGPIENSRPGICPFYLDQGLNLGPRWFIKVECSNLEYIGVADSKLCWIYIPIQVWSPVALIDWLMLRSVLYTHEPAQPWPTISCYLPQCFCHHMRVRIDVKSLTFPIPHKSQQLSTNGHPPGTCYNMHMTLSQY